MTSRGDGRVPSPYAVQEKVPAVTWEAGSPATPLPSPPPTLATDHLPPYLSLPTTTPNAAPSTSSDAR